MVVLTFINIKYPNISIRKLKYTNFVHPLILY